MKISLRTGILIAFAIFIALSLGASRLAHVVSGRELLEEELVYASEDFKAVCARLEKLLDTGDDAEGLELIDQSYKMESIGRWDCCYVLSDTADVVVAPFALAGKQLEYSVYQQREDGITLGTFSGHKVAIFSSRVGSHPYSVTGLYDKDYLLGDSHYMEGSYRIILLAIIALLLLVAWIWVIPAVERIVARRRSAEQTLSLARNIQQKAVTQKFPSDERVDTFAILKPMYDVGGDIYGCQMVGNKLCFVIGDVSGKGIVASFLMFMVSSLVFPAFKRGQAPAEIAAYLNDLICENSDYDMFCTMLLGTIDMDTLEMEYCNAGHTRTLIDNVFLPQERNFVLGGFSGFQYKSQKITLPRGSRLVLYTDGVTEARNQGKVFYGEDSLLRWAQRTYGSARQTCESLMEEVSAFRGRASQNDDIAIMTILVK